MRMLALVPALAVLAACGSGEHRMSLREWRAQLASAVCRVPDPFAKLSRAHGRLAPDYVGAGVRAQRALVGALASVPLPDDKTQKVKQLIEIERSVLEVVESNAPRQRAVFKRLLNAIEHGDRSHVKPAPRNLGPTAATLYEARQIPGVRKGFRDLDRLSRQIGRAGRNAAPLIRDLGAAPALSHKNCG